MNRWTQEINCINSMTLHSRSFLNLIHLRKVDKTQSKIWINSSITWILIIKNPIHHTINYGYKLLIPIKRYKSISSLSYAQLKSLKKSCRNYPCHSHTDNTNQLIHMKNKTFILLWFKTLSLLYTSLINSNQWMDLKTT